MGSKLINLVGARFNRLVVLKKVESRLYGTTKKRMWECLCDCGKTITVCTGSLSSNTTSSCGCYASEVKGQNGTKSRYKIAKRSAGYRRIFTSYISNAINRGVEFSLTDEQFYELLNKNCHYCNIEPSNLLDKTYYAIKYNGVDRKDNNKGYTLENSVPCCRMCNIAKNKNTYEEFINWAIRLNNNLPKLKDELK
jgi:hypothetical protein